MIYEAVLLFGVLFTADFLFLFLTESMEKSAAIHIWQNIYLFVVLGIYFTYFWGHGGQTLPMQTWHIKVVSSNGQPVTFRQACIRYCGAWMWFLPALGIIDLFKFSTWIDVTVFLAGITVWALSSKFDKNGQFLHDKIAGTQIVNVPKVKRVPDTE